MIASASSGGAGLFFVYALAVFIIFLALSVLIFLVYLLRNMSHGRLFSMGLIISVVYAFLINFAIPHHDILEMLGFAIYSSIAFFVVFSLILLTRRMQGKNIASLIKVFLHGIISSILVIILSFSFGSSAEAILYQTNCDMNLIINQEDREGGKYDCVNIKAQEKISPIFCNKLSRPEWVSECKLGVNVEMLVFGNLNACDYIRPRINDLNPNAGFSVGPDINAKKSIIWGEVVSKCRPFNNTPIIKYSGQWVQARFVSGYDHLINIMLPSTWYFSCCSSGQDFKVHTIYPHPVSPGSIIDDLDTSPVITVYNLIPREGDTTSSPLQRLDLYGTFKQTGSIKLANFALDVPVYRGFSHFSEIVDLYLIQSPKGVVGVEFQQPESFDPNLKTEFLNKLTD